MGIAQQTNSELMPVLKKGEIYLKKIERLKPTKADNCWDFIKRLRVLHKKYGKKHLVKEKKICDGRFTDRWQDLHQVATDLYALGFYLKQPTKIKRKHCIALCKAWEAAGFAASAIANKKTGLRTILAWSGRVAVLDDIKLEDLFEYPKCIYRPTKTKVDKSMSAGMSNVDLEAMFGIDLQTPRVLWDTLPSIVLEHLHQEIKKRQAGGMKNKQRDERFVLMLELILLFGLRTREAAFFNASKDIAYDGKCRMVKIHVRKQGAKGARTRTVDIYEPRQVELLKRLKNISHIRDMLMLGDSKSIQSWLAQFYKFTAKNGLTKENNMQPYSLRHEFAQSLLEFYTGEPSPVRANGKTLDKRLLKDAKSIVSSQLGHHRPSITGAYIG